MAEAPDDDSVRNEDPLWRRVVPVQMVTDANGASRPSSAAFENSSDGSGMSVTLGREARADGVTPQVVLKRFPRCRIASLTAGQCRDHKQKIARDPTKEDPHHALVNGTKTKSTRKAFATLACWVE